MRKNITILFKSGNVLQFESVDFEYHYESCQGLDLSKIMSTNLVKIDVSQVEAIYAEPVVSKN